MGRIATKVDSVVNAATNVLGEATLGVHQEAFYQSVTEAADSTVVCATPAVLYGLWVTAAFSANVTAIKDGTTTILSIPASAAVGTFYSFPFGIRCETNLTIDPVDAGTGGVVTVFYRPL